MFNPCFINNSISIQRNPRYGGVVLSGWNPKLGNVMGFSLPRGITCPGQSEWCLKYCYARSERHASTSAAWQQNLKAAKGPDFVEDMVYGIRELLRTGIPMRIPTTEDKRLGREATGIITNIQKMEHVVRIHTSGDFFSVPYVNKWIEIVQDLPHIRFYTYTRCWRSQVNPLLRNAVYDFKNIPNVSILASTDPTTGPAPRGWRECGIDATWLGQKAFRCPHNDTPTSMVLCVDCQHCFYRYPNDVYLPHHSMGVLQAEHSRTLKTVARARFPQYGAGQEDWRKNPRW